jgi:PAS domain S-box-containing protein
VTDSERDIERLRKLLLEYIEEREATEDALRIREAALRESEARYRSLIQRAAYGIFRASLTGQFVDVNPALVTMLGYDSATALLAADMARDIFYEPSDELRIIRDAVEGRVTGWTEVKWRRRDGAPVLVRLTMQVVRDADGAAVAVEGITEDISERSRREELLRRSERMASLGHMLAGVAHELNNPLAAVCGFAQLLLKQNLQPDEHAAVETMNHEALRAAKIVRDLLTFSRRQEFERREPVDLNEVVRYIVDAQRYQIDTRGITFRMELAANLPRVLAQASQLEQVVLNLVVNARQALEKVIDETSAEEASRGASAHPLLLTVRTARGDGVVTLEVSDTGPGIREEHRARIWDPFWTTKEEGEGTGLGLSVVHGIVAGYGGTIDVETELGAGTRFVVTLPTGGAATATDVPVPDERSQSSHPPTAEKPATGDSGSRDSGGRAGDRTGRAPIPLDVLVVDDEVSILSFVQRYLARRGHAVITATDGEAALRLAEQTPFDVVICDLRMPGIGGAEVIRRLRALPTGRHARVVISSGDTAVQMTSSGGVGSSPDFADLGISAIVEKPYEIELLRRAVETAAEADDNGG